MSLRNFPDANTSITLDFLKGKKLDPRITFERASSATEIGEGTGAVNGQLFEFQENVPRLTDKGLLMEESRTNILPNSLIDNAWNSQLVDNSAIAPDGALTASTVVPTSGQQLKPVTAIVLPNAGVWTWSAFVQPSPNLTYFIMGFNSFNDTGNNGAHFDTTKTGINGDGIIPLITNNANFIGGTMDKNYPNGWVRLSITCNIVAPDLYGQVDIGNVNPSFGDGVSSIAYWQGQLEEGSFPTSYIPTSGATATRAQDVLDITGNELSSFWNPTAGTIVTSIEPIDTGRLWSIWSGQNRRIDCSNNDANQRFTNTLTTNLSGTTYTGQVQGPASVDVVNEPTKIAFSFSAGYMEGAYDGVLGTSPGTKPDSVPPVSTWSFFKNHSGGQLSSGYLSRIDYYPTTVTADALEALTS